MRKNTLIFMISFFIFGTICSAQAKTTFPQLLEQARNGDAEAMCDVALAYYKGKGTLKNPFKAKCWIQKAHGLESDRAEKIWDDLELWKYSGSCDESFDDEVLPKNRQGESYDDAITGTRFIWVPKGCFKMGCHAEAGKCSKDEKPAHRVCLDGYWIGSHEVTQQLWNRIMGTNPSRFSSNVSHPVENVSYNDVQKFLQKLNKVSRHTYVLPTEAQWEYACRNGGQKMPYPWEEDVKRPDANCGNCNSNGYYGQTAPVGTYPPNEIGLYDMGGNVKEWCQDNYDKKAYASHEKKNPVYKKRGAMKVVRGGSYLDASKKLRCSDRDKSIPTVKTDFIGFRLILKKADSK